MMDAANVHFLVCSLASRQEMRFFFLNHSNSAQNLHACKHARSQLFAHALVQGKYGDELYNWKRLWARLSVPQCPLDFSSLVLDAYADCVYSADKRTMPNAVYAVEPHTDAMRIYLT